MGKAGREEEREDRKKGIKRRGRREEGKGKKKKGEREEAGEEGLA